MAPLEGEPQPELDLSRRAERVDPCPHPNAVDIMAGGSSSIDLSGCSRQQSVQRSAWQIKVGKVEKIVETDTWSSSRSLIV
jgi:ribosomal protein RSM22 (predicted rRNA methylase)